ncbi:MAG: glycosyltransferase family 2 protein [Paracoccaceae bacterium]
MTDHNAAMEIAAVVIGRNEGQRLIQCLESLRGACARIIYVDSGSTDGSAAAAGALGAEVIALDMDQPFTAARARNAGIAALRHGDVPRYIQFVDGDCELQEGWLQTAHAFLEQSPQAAAACGRRRERFPEASIYNRHCDREWDTPVGKARSCGGDVMIRMSALEEVGGYDPSLIAGEEPEMCVRLRAKGWEIWRLDAEMTLHDAALTKFSQFWKRARRGGHAWAEGAAMHGAAPEFHSVPEVRRALFWGAALPALIVLLALVLGPVLLLLFALYPLQIARLARKRGGTRAAWEAAFLLTAGKFAEALGALEYHWRKRFKRPSGLIEYK